MTLKGIDVSAHNGLIDWQTVKDAGIQFAIIRAGYGNDISQKDQYFDRNIQGAINAGIPVGVYWFSYATSVEDAKKEAETCKTVIAPYKDQITWPVFFDFEYDSVRWCRQNGVNPGAQLVTDMALTFLQNLQSAGFKVGNYANLDYCRNWFQMERLSDFPLWFAQYGVDSPALSCPIWQFGGTSVPGCSGSIDTNIAYTDLSNGTVPVATQTVASVVSPIRDISAAYRVRTAENGWLSEVWDDNDFAGVVGHKITDIAIGVTKGTVKYRVHVCGGDWLPYVTGYDISDSNNGYAGNGKEIDALEVYYSTPDGITTHYAKYKVSPNKQSYYPEQIDDQTGNGMDGYAGQFGNTIDRVQIVISK